MIIPRILNLELLARVFYSRMGLFLVVVVGGFIFLKMVRYYLGIIRPVIEPSHDLEDYYHGEVVDYMTDSERGDVAVGSPADRREAYRNGYRRRNSDARKHRSAAFRRYRSDLRRGFSSFDGDFYDED